MLYEDEAKAVIAALNGTKIDKSKIRVKEAE
jgi:RNA recognition motif-containing protein